MSYNTFGQMFRFTTWGESHGPAIGVVVDGCPPGIPLTAEMIQRDLERRKPGQSRFTTQRREDDLVTILSGVFEDEADSNVLKTTGTPISLLIENTDQRSKDYSEIKDKFRPELVLDLGIVLGALVGIFDEQRDRRAGGLEDVAVGFVLEDAREDGDEVVLAALRGKARLARLAPLKIALDHLRRQRNARRAAVDNDADGRAVALTPGG